MVETAGDVKRPETMIETLTGQKICMVEYQGRCDESGTVVGHAPKVLREYCRMLQEDYALEVLAPAGILQAAWPEGEGKALKAKDEPATGGQTQKGVATDPARERRKNKGMVRKILPHKIVMRGKTPFLEKILNKLRMFANIHTALKYTKADMVWFFNTEFYLVLYLALFGNRGKRIICTFFLDGWHGGAVAWVKQKIFEKAQKKMECILAGSRGFTFKNCLSVFLPDYPYDAKEYAGYEKCPKEERAVCLGTMGAEKDLEGLVEAFRELSYPLHIAGRFYDEERFRTLKERAGARTLIENRYLSREEYLSLLGEARYCILPYRAKQYKTQTSGVLQEALFLNTVPVAAKEILEAHRIPGIGFDALSDLKDPLFAMDTSPFLDTYEKLRREEYSFDGMKKKLLDLIRSFD